MGTEKRSGDCFGASRSSRGWTLDAKGRKWLAQFLSLDGAATMPLGGFVAAAGALAVDQRDHSDLFSTPVSYFPRHPTFGNYRLVFENRQFVRSLLNSVIVAFSVTALSLVIGTIGAYALGRFKFHGRTAVLYLILSMTMFPQIAILGALYTMVNRFHLYNRLGALVLTYLLFTLPFTVWVLTNFFRGMPGELEEAAYVDGATPLQTFYHVLLPLATPALVTTGLLAFIQAWNEFIFALSFTQTPAHRTVPLAIFYFVPQTSGGFEIPRGQIMAATVIVTIPLVVLLLIFQRRILAGLTAGAVKG